MKKIDKMSKYLTLPINPQSKYYPTIF